MRFEWDSAKAELNAAKHGVTFSEATETFADPFALTRSDPRHSTVEARFVTMGRTTRDVIVVVAHTDRVESIRIISARKAVTV
jgi:uncharacterized DUF497 family protein